MTQPYVLFVCVVSVLGSGFSSSQNGSATTTDAVAALSLELSRVVAGFVQVLPQYLEFATDNNRALLGRSYFPIFSILQIQGPWVTQNSEHRLFAAAYFEHCDGVNSTAAGLAECAAAVGLAGVWPKRNLAV